jgi:hypothetical protein
MTFLTKSSNLWSFTVKLVYGEVGEAELQICEAELQIVKLIYVLWSWFIAQLHQLHHRSRVSLQAKHFKNLSNFTVKLIYGEVGEAELSQIGPITAYMPTNLGYLFSNSHMPFTVVPPVFRVQPGSLRSMCDSSLVFAPDLWWEISLRRWFNSFCKCRQNVAVLIQLPWKGGDLFVTMLSP